MKTVDLIVPCYNESEVLSMFYEEVCSVAQKCSDYGFKFIFINDGSSDSTLEIIGKLAQKDKRVKYISFSRNFGKEAAMLAGMSYSSGDYVGIIDADLQHSPELLIDMIKAVDIEGYDVAAARRVDRQGESKLKSALSRRFYRVISKLSDVEIQDGAQDFRVMTRKVVKAILSMPEYNRFSKGIFTWVGFKTKWFEHENRERAAGNTKWSIAKLFKYAIDGIIGFSTTPLKISFMTGVVFSTLGTLYAVYIIIDTIINGPDVAGYPSIICLIVLMSGLILTSLGIVGEYIAKIYMEVKRRPLFLVDTTNIDKRD
ncbi:MAG TPA: glycosyltransferase family 2 protein [Clostridia bacterium]|nr:glycosyltransferase family 2 protein [Clostridia bacterium]